MENINNNYSDIKGWGVDADPKNDPTYPMKHHTPGEHDGYSWQRPIQQKVNIEVLHSTERPNVSAVFGTSVPPKGLSGKIRRFAFKYSEGSFGHWLPLIFADRVNVVEGIIDDFSKGKFPNLFAEKGGKARWKYNKKAVLTNMAIGVGLITATVGLLATKNRSLVETLP
jgi:hypothetical protein